MAEQKLASMATKDMVKGGLIDDIDIEVVASRYCVWDYDHTGQGNGTSGRETNALRWDMKQPDGSVALQFWSAGSVESFDVVDVGEIEGAGLAPSEHNTTGGKMVDSTNVRLLMASLETAGYPVDKLESGRADQFVGLHCHVKRVPAPKRVGLDQEGDKDKFVLIVSEIQQLPGEKRKGTKKTAQKTTTTGTTSAAVASTPAATPAAATAPAASSNGDVDAALSDQALSVFADLMMANNNAIPVKSIKLMAMSHMHKTPDAPSGTNRIKVAALLTNTDWLAEAGATVDDDGNIVM